MKTCTKCEVKKPLADFARHAHTKDRRRHECRICWAAYSKRDRKKNPVRDRGYVLKRFYKMTHEDYERMMTAQNGCCAICGTDKPGPSHYKFLCVDHDHSTGRVRGLLCRRCNSVLGYVEDSVGLLASAIRYLSSSKGGE